MKASIHRVSQILLFAVFPFLSLNATEAEAYYGFYSYRSPDLKIEFLLDDSGLSQVRIGSDDDDGPFGYDALGQFGDTALIEIKPSKKSETTSEIKLMILLNGSKVELVTGYYAELRHKGAGPEKTFVTKRLKPITMNFTPLAEHKRKHGMTQKCGRPL